MSYLPRMSKTYKEPQLIVLDEEFLEDDLSMNGLKPASSLLAEGTHNPQMALKHYKFVPHPLPVLPGPSVVEEAMENELSREASRLRRSMSKIESLPSSSEVKSELQIKESVVLKEEEEESKLHLKRTASKRNVRKSKTAVGKKKSSKVLLDKKKEGAKHGEVVINMCLVDSGVSNAFSAPQTERKDQEEPEPIKKDDPKVIKSEETPLIDINLQKLSPKSEKSTKKKNLEEAKLEEKRKESKNRSVQCTIFGSSEKIFVVPPVIYSLLRTLAFLLHELNREENLSGSSVDRKSLMTQIQLMLGDLCSQKIQTEFGFDTTYSDSKRLEKILGDLQKYMKDVYGDKGEYIDRMEDLKRVFVELKKKEMELNVLREKLAESEELKTAEVSIKESYFKNPEITLQNKRLEREQLAAEVEFSTRELRDYQKTLAEIDWDIKNTQDQMTSLKKTIASKSKTEIPGRRSSVHKFSSEAPARGSKSKESQNHLKKKI